MPDLIYSAKWFLLAGLLVVALSWLGLQGVLPPWVYQTSWEWLLLPALLFGAISYVLSPSADLAYLLDVGRLDENVLDVGFMNRKEIDVLRRKEGLVRIFSTSDGEPVVVANDMAVGLPGRLSPVHTLGLLEYLADVTIIKKVAVPLRLMTIENQMLAKYLGVQVAADVCLIVPQIVRDLDPKASPEEWKQFFNEVVEIVRRTGSDQDVSKLLADIQESKPADAAARQSDGEGSG